MIEANLEMTDKIGYLLFKKGILDSATLEKALLAKTNDKSKIRRNLAQILVQDFNFDHDKIFREVSILYAFRELETKSSDIPDERIEAIKNLMDQSMHLPKPLPLVEAVPGKLATTCIPC